MGTALVQLPDGRKAQVQFDTQEQLNAVINDLTGTQQTSHASDPSLYSTSDAAENKALQLGKDAATVVGRAGKYIAQGAPALLGMVADAPGRIYDAASTALGGQPSPSYAKPYQSYVQALESPQLAETTPTERVLADVSRGVAGAAGGIGTGTVLAGAGAPAVANTGQVLTQQAGRQLTSAATSAAAGSIAKENGVGPIGQFLWSLAGGAAPGVAEATIRAVPATAKTAVSMARPLTRSGQEQVAGQILSDSAINPRAAQENLTNAESIVPGSQITSGPASQDPGLLAVEKGLRGKNPAPFGVRNSEQNAARQSALDTVAGSQADIDAAQAARKAETTPMREQSLGTTAKADIAPVQQKIDAILASPIGKRDVASSALNWLKGKLDGVDKPADLYAIRQDIGDAMAGKLAGDRSSFNLAKSQLVDVRGTLDDAIEAAAPGFKDYLKRYSELSKPIDQMKVMQEIQARSELNGGADITTGRQFLSPASFTRELKKAVVGDAKLTADQVQQLSAIKTDLDYGAAINSPLIKAPGSDTFQNLSIASALGSRAAKGTLHPILGALTKPLNWLYKMPDEQITQVLTQAMLDPKMAARLMSRATPKSVSSFSGQLQASARGYGLGTSTGAAATTQSPAPSTSSR